ncbi:protein phosphatase 2C family protein [Actinidia rufa]|uniref:protein-serine/threonine phosphatase n=1 Tax=Actinidia rufa TaxID=165716 RepID=A0A7J0F9J9_9ERIC|nr:protein phosphatase 2C family protein [Actinidia rufa]
MLSGLMNFLRACFRPRSDWRGHSGSDSGRQDGLLWYKDTGQHFNGDFSMAVVQANNLLEDQSQIESGSLSTHDSGPYGTFVGIYDGHGGPETSRYINEHLFQHLKRFTSEQQFMSVEIAAVGSCCLVGVICNGTLYISNLGDSRAVLGRLVKSTGEVLAIQLSAEHNVAIESVRQEMKSLHPDDSKIVVLKHNVWRVKGLIQLAADHGEIAYPHRRTTRGLSEHPRGLLRVTEQRGSLSKSKSTLIGVESSLVRSVSKQISHSHSPRRRLTIGSAFPTRSGRVSDEIGASFRQASEKEAPIRGSQGDSPPLCKIPATKDYFILQISRSIGDVYLKKPEFNREPLFAKFRLREPFQKPILSAEPSITVHQLQPHDQFLIFASDGLWEHLSNQEAVDIVQNHPHSGSARRLVKVALQEAAKKREMRYSDLKKIDRGVRRHFHDDITVIVVFLDSNLVSRASSVRSINLSVKGGGVTFPSSTLAPRTTPA